MKRLAICLLACLLALSPGASRARPPAVEASPGPWVDWDPASEHVVSAVDDAGAAYPRARQLSNGEILLAYHHGEALGNYGSKVTLRKSRDGGATWYQTQEIDGPKERGYWGFCNPDFIELGHGRLMLVSAARPKADPLSRDKFLTECRRGGLRVRFSNDYGTTWGPPRMIAAGRGRVWEPSIVRLPGGELQVFYANESPDLQEEGCTQGVECTRSTDDGRSWSSPTLVAGQRECRNGMPTALVLGNGHVACAQEVVGMATSPWIADTLQGKTQGFHLAQDQYDFGAAPFLARAADNSTLLVFHSQLRQNPAFKEMNGSWLFSDIYVQHGDAQARFFGPASCPWPPTDDRNGAFFPSLMVMRDGSLVALASFITIHPNRTATTVVRWIKGKLAATNPAPLRGEPLAAQPLSREGGPVSVRGARPSSPATARDDSEYKYGPPPDPETSGHPAGD